MSGTLIDCVASASPGGIPLNIVPAEGGRVASKLLCRSFCSACIGTVAPPKSKKVCQPMKRLGALAPPRKSRGRSCLPRGIENHTKEWLPLSP